MQVYFVVHMETLCPSTLPFGSDEKKGILDGLKFQVLLWCSKFSAKLQTDNLVH